MTCRRSRRLLHLTGEEELSARDRRRLERHLHSCAACALEAERIKHADRYLQKLVRARPDMGDADEFTESVMTRIRHVPGPPSVRRPWDWIFVFADIAATPRVRLATGVFASAVLALFLLQELSLIADVQSLERTMAAATNSRSAPIVSYSVSSDVLRQDPVFRDWTDRFIPTQTYAPGDPIVISKQSLTALLAKVEEAPSQLMSLQSHLGLDNHTVLSLVGRLQRHAAIRIHISLKGN